MKGIAGFIWLSIGTSGVFFFNMVMNLGVPKNLTNLLTKWGPSNFQE